MLGTPNLFSFATSELSQDAFICWILSWAKPENRIHDPELNECACRLLDAFFDKHHKNKPDTYNKIEVRKQDNSIDILCIVNDNYYILIEDKTWSKNHSDQLQRYIEQIKSRNIGIDNIIPIYFKTIDQSDYDEIYKNGYSLFNRSDFLCILNNGYKNGIRNHIFIDYLNHLQEIDDLINSYKILPISEWKWESWQGFFIELQKLLKTGNWDYVPNPSGGFLGFWWHFQEDADCEQYLQLEQEKFCFKISVDDISLRTDLRDKWHETIKNISSIHGIDAIKPQRFGQGQYMTVAILNEDYRQKNHDGTINMEKTIDLLKRAENILDFITKNKITNISV